MKFVLNNLDWIVPSLIAAAALGFAIWSAHSSHVSRNASERSAAAAEASAKADEEQAALAREERAAAHKRLRQRPWVLTKIGDFSHRVVNQGDLVYAVEVAGPDLHFTVEAGSRGLQVVRHGEAFDMVVMKGLEADGDLTISWAESEGPEAVRLEQHELF